MDKPGQAPIDIDLPQPTKPQGKPTVDPKATSQAPAQLAVKADQGEEEIVELEEKQKRKQKAKPAPPQVAPPAPPAPQVNENMTKKRTRSQGGTWRNPMQQQRLGRRL